MTCCEHEHERCREPQARARSLAAAEVLTLLLLAAFLGYAWITGRVEKFVAPAYVWMPLAASVLLVLMALGRLMREATHTTDGFGTTCRNAAPQDSQGIQPAPSCACTAHGAHPVRWLLTAALVIPVGLVLAVDPQDFSSQGSRKRRMPAVARDAQLDRAVDWVLGRTARTADTSAARDVPAEPTVLQLAQAADSGQGATWAGRFVTVIGQCDVSANGTQTIELYRLVVTCCVADSQSVGVLVMAPATGRLDPRQWVRVAGVLRWDAPAARLVIEAATITPIPIPAVPYL